MALTKYNGMQETMPGSFSSMLDRFFNESVNARNFSGFTPHVDACETEGGFELSIALPGVKKEDISIDFQEGKLTVTGERKFEKKEDNRRYHMLETQYGSFTRTLYLPDNINADSISARLEDGVLQVFVPKDEHKTKKRQISISTGEKQVEQISSNGRKAEKEPAGKKE